MTKRIKLMAEYDSDPLWWEGPEQVGPIEPATLPLSVETISRLLRWQEDYNARINWDDPASSRKFSPDELEVFEREGIEIWTRLREDLSPNYEVVYFSERLRRVVDRPEQL